MWLQEEASLESSGAYTRLRASGALPAGELPEGEKVCSPDALAICAQVRLVRMRRVLLLRVFLSFR